MILNFKSKKHETNASANVVDGKLILSLPDALSPVVWQMDLTQAKASALEVLHNEDKEQHSLNLKNPKGETIEIAVFEERNHAVEGLMAASGALENAQGQIRPGGTNTNGATNTTPRVQTKNAPQNIRGKWIGAILALVVLFILFTIWSSIVPRPIGTSTSGTASTGSVSNPQESSGVPVSADDFLRGQ